MTLLLQIGAVIHLGFALFHLSFSQIFNWRTELEHLSPLNRAIVLVVNLCLSFWFGWIGIISLSHTEALLAPGLGRSMIASIAVFWIFRGILQVTHFKLKKWGSWAMLLIFLLVAAGYSTIWFKGLSP